MDEIKQKIALFIDADNAPAGKFEDVLINDGEKSSWPGKELFYEVIPDSNVGNQG